MTVNLDAVEFAANATRTKHRALADAKPLVRVWANKTDGENGLALRGIVKDSISGSFPWKLNEAASGVLKLRHDHYVAKWLLSIRNDPEAKKNSVITVDHMGGKIRWSGILRSVKWSRDSAGLRYVEATYVDDLQYWQFTLGPPNPALPIPVFQFPRVLPIVGPTCWAASFLMLINVMRIEGNWWTLPDDPFDWSSWTDSFDMSQWQVLVKSPSLLEDSSLWTILPTRMDALNTVVQDALDDAKCALTYRRILTIDGETPADFGIDYVDSCPNGTLVLSVEDKSGYYAASGTAFGGALASGFTRSIVEFAEGYVEEVYTSTSTDIVYPDEYYEHDFFGVVRGFPWIMLRDTKWSQIETAEYTWSPATATSVIVGGDNPYADQAAELLIQSVGNILGYFLLAGFSSAGDIAASVIMPFLEGTIAAWDQWENGSRATDLGWVHLWEIFQQGAESNAWSLSAIMALRAGFQATREQTVHQFTMAGGGPIYPGLHCEIGDRIGSWFEGMGSSVFVDQLEEMSLGWDYSSNNSSGHAWELKVGTNAASLTAADRAARMLSKVLDTVQNVGVHLIS